jgi:hypothetical protein
MKAAKKSITPSERAAEIAKLDLRPTGQAKKRTDDLLRTMLNSPPDPYTPKAKPKKRAK